MIFLAVLLTSLTVTALPVIRGERLFKLETSGGEISYLLAAPHDPVAPHQKNLLPVKRAVRESCQVWLQGDLYRATDLERDLPLVRPGHLRRLLSPDRIATYRQVVGPAEAYLEVRSPVAAALIRGSYGDAMSEAVGPFDRELHEAVLDDQELLLNQAVLDPRLDRAVRGLYGASISPAELILMTVKKGHVHAGDDGGYQSLGDLVGAEARARGLPVTTLNAPEGQSVMAAQLRLHGDHHLRAMLDELRPRLADLPTLFVDLQVGYLIGRELADRYFDVTPAEYGQYQALLARSLAGRTPFFEGDEALADHEANLHAHWFDELAEAVDFGGALIVVDAARAIPGVNPRVRRTVLDELESRGVTVTPLAAERTTVRLVK